MFILLRITEIKDKQQNYTVSSDMEWRSVNWCNQYNGRNNIIWTKQNVICQISCANLKSIYYCKYYLGSIHNWYTALTIDVK